MCTGAYINVFGPFSNADELRSLRNSFFPRYSEALRMFPVWGMSTNSEGFRDSEFPKTKAASSFRIICLGDSWTFGQGAGPEDTYPRRLKGLLARQFPNANVEVFNLGVLGYSSYHGRRLLSRAMELSPDVVVLAFAMNEPTMAGFVGPGPGLKAKQDGIAVKAATFVSQNLEVFKLLRYWALRLRWTPESIAEGIESLPRKQAWRQDGADPGQREPWLQASLQQYEAYHREMIRVARSHGADAILLYNVFWKTSPYFEVLERLSREMTVPLVASNTLLAEARRMMEDELERELDLQPPMTDRTVRTPETDVVFRVYVGDRPVQTPVYVVGNHPELGDLVPNKVVMYDDGTHGDQRAGDNVWSYSVPLAGGTDVFYMYTNGGTEGRWDGLDVQHVRTFTVGREDRTYRPIESFGMIPLQTDNWHTDASGYEIIARALVEVLTTNARLAYLSRLARPPLAP